MRKKGEKRGRLVFVQLPVGVRADVYHSRVGMPESKLFDAIPLGRGQLYQIDALDIDRIQWGQSLMVYELLSPAIGGIVLGDNALTVARLSVPVVVDWRLIWTSLSRYR
jgi:hypothetical protein